MVRHWKPSPSYLDEVWWAKTKHLYGAALPAIPNTHPSCDLLMMLYITWNEWNHSILLSMSFLSGNVPKLFNVLSCLTCVRLRQKSYLVRLKWSFFHHTALPQLTWTLLVFFSFDLGKTVEDNISGFDKGEGCRTRCIDKLFIATPALVCQSLGNTHVPSPGWDVATKTI